MSGPSGTQSPPLEATGEHVVMGVSSVGGGKVDIVPDNEQRKKYFESSGDKPLGYQGREVSKEDKGKKSG